MNRWHLAIIIIIGLLLVTAVYAASQPHTTRIFKVNHNVGCIVLDDKGLNLTNVTVTQFGVLPLAGQTFVVDYSVENIGSAFTSLTGIAVTGDSQMTSAVSGITFPIALAPGSSTPFTVTWTTQAPITTATTDPAQLITATCV